MEILIKLVKCVDGYERHYRTKNGIRIEFTAKPGFDYNRWGKVDTNTGINGAMKSLRDYSHGLLTVVALLGVLIGFAGCTKDGKKAQVMDGPVLVSPNDPIPNGGY